MRADDGIDQPLASLGDLVVGERALGRAERDREREAHATGTDRIRTEDVEQLDPLGQVAGRVAQCAKDRARRHVLVNDEREVDRGSREPGDRTVCARLACSRARRVEVELEADGRRGQVERVDHLGGDLTDNTHR